MAAILACIYYSLPLPLPLCDTNRCRNPENRWCWEWMKLYNVWHTEVTDMKSWSEIVSICLYIINIVLWRKRKLTNLARSVSSREMVSTLYELSNKPFWNRISLLPRYCDKLLRKKRDPFCAFIIIFFTIKAIPIPVW